MRHALTIVGRFAFSGWVLGTGIVLLITLLICFAQGFSRDWAGMLLMFVYGSLGLVGGAVVGVIAAVLDRVIKVPPAKTKSAEDAVLNDPAVWPPAPKRP